MIVTRRGFLKGMAGILAAAAAPAIITTPGLLMPVRKIIVPPGAREVQEWLEECQQRIAKSMAADLEHVLTYGQPMTATEVIARQEEGFRLLGQAFLNSMPPDRQWFTLKLKDQA